jgi:hypothetical protein
MPTTVTICCDEPWEAKGMLNWYKYRSACIDIHEYIRSKLKHGEVSDDVYRALLDIQLILPAREEED